MRKVTEITSRLQKEEKMVRGHEEEEGQHRREGGREMNHFFKKKIKPGVQRYFLHQLLGAPTKMLGAPSSTPLVDERLSIKGTGLPFGLSHNLLGMHQRYYIRISFYFPINPKLNKLF